MFWVFSYSSPSAVYKTKSLYWISCSSWFCFAPCVAKKRQTTFTFFLFNSLFSFGNTLTLIIFAYLMKISCSMLAFRWCWLVTCGVIVTYSINSFHKFIFFNWNWFYISAECGCPSQFSLYGTFIGKSLYKSWTWALPQQVAASFFFCLI